MNFSASTAKNVDEILALVNHEEGDAVCPHFDSKNVERRWSAFSAITSKNSA
jgi:hypothetical protein